MKSIICLTFFFFCSRKQVVYSLITQQQLRETYSCTHAYKSSQTCSGDNWQIRFILFSSSLVLCPFLMLPCATTHITHFKNCHFMNIFKNMFDKMFYCLIPNMSEDSQVSMLLYSGRLKGNHFVLNVKIQIKSGHTKRFLLSCVYFQSGTANTFHLTNCARAHLWQEVSRTTDPGPDHRRTSPSFRFSQLAGKAESQGVGFINDSFLMAQGACDSTPFTQKWLCWVWILKQQHVNSCIKDWAPEEQAAGRMLEDERSSESSEHLTFLLAPLRCGRWQAKERTGPGDLRKTAESGISERTSDTPGLCRAFFLKGKIGPLGHGPTFSSSEETRREIKRER